AGAVVGPTSLLRADSPNDHRRSEGLAVKRLSSSARGVVVPGIARELGTRLRLDRELRYVETRFDESLRRVQVRERDLRGRVIGNVTHVAPRVKAVLRNLELREVDRHRGLLP